MDNKSPFSHHTSIRIPQAARHLLNQNHFISNSIQPWSSGSFGVDGLGKKIGHQVLQQKKSLTQKKQFKNKKIFLPNRFRHHRNPPTAALNFGTRLGLWLSRWFPKPATHRWDGWVRRVAFSNHGKAMAMRVFYLVASGKR